MDLDDKEKAVFERIQAVAKALQGRVEDDQETAIALTAVAVSACVAHGLKRADIEFFVESAYLDYACGLCGGRLENDALHDPETGVGFCPAHDPRPKK